MAGRLAQFVARVARPHLPAWPRLAPQPMPVAPVSTPAAAPSPFAKHLAKLRALSPELHPPDTPLGRLRMRVSHVRALALTSSPAEHLRNWVRTRNGMLTANVLLGGAASAAFVNPAPSADASTAGEGAVRATLNSPFEEYGFTFTNWDALSPSSKTLAPILAVNTVIWGVWQMAVRAQRHALSLTVCAELLPHGAVRAVHGGPLHLLHMELEELSVRALAIRYAYSVTRASTLIHITRFL